jgi:hypothetical protein
MSVNETGTWTSLATPQGQIFFETGDVFTVVMIEPVNNLVEDQSSGLIVYQNGVLRGTFTADGNTHLAGAPFIFQTDSESPFQFKAAYYLSALTPDSNLPLDILDGIPLPVAPDVPTQTFDPYTNIVPTDNWNATMQTGPNDWQVSLPGVQLAPIPADAAVTMSNNRIVITQGNQGLYTAVFTANDGQNPATGTFYPYYTNGLWEIEYWVSISAAGNPSDAVFTLGNGNNTDIYFTMTGNTYTSVYGQGSGQLIGHTLKVKTFANEFSNYMFSLYDNETPIVLNQPSSQPVKLALSSTIGPQFPIVTFQVDMYSILNSEVPNAIPYTQFAMNNLPSSAKSIAMSFMVPSTAIADGSYAVTSKDAVPAGFLFNLNLNSAQSTYNLYDTTTNRNLPAANCSPGQRFTVVVNEPSTSGGVCQYYVYLENLPIQGPSNVTFPPTATAPGLPPFFLFTNIPLSAPDASNTLDNVSFYTSDQLCTGETIMLGS